MIELRAVEVDVESKRALDSANYTLTERSGHKLYALATANPELVHDQPGGRFDNVCLLASSEAGHCAGVAAALRKLAERFDSLELANNKPTKLDA